MTALSKPQLRTMILWAVAWAAALIFVCDLAER